MQSKSENRQSDNIMVHLKPVEAARNTFTQHKSIITWNIQVGAYSWFILGGGKASINMIFYLWSLFTTLPTLPCSLGVELRNL